MRCTGSSPPPGAPPGGLGSASDFTIGWCIQLGKTIHAKTAGQIPGCLQRLKTEKCSHTIWLHWLESEVRKQTDRVERCLVHPHTRRETFLQVPSPVSVSMRYGWTCATKRMPHSTYPSAKQQHIGNLSPSIFRRASSDEYTTYTPM